MKEFQKWHQGFNRKWDYFGRRTRNNQPMTLDQTTKRHGFYEKMKALKKVEFLWEQYRHI